MQRYSLEEIRALITLELIRICRRYSAQAALIGIDFRDLLYEIERFVSNGGKRLRPYLTYLAYIGRGGEHFEEVLPYMAAVEFCHLFLLIHDDCVDGDFVRYGKPNIAGRYLEKTGSSAKAFSAALLAGDVVYGMALSCLQDDYTKEMLEKTVFRTLGGELLDVFGSASATNHKTSEYSFTLPLILGSYAAGSMINPTPFSQPIGIAYQLRDDYLGMFSAEEVLGKSITSDLREGKATLLYTHAYEHARGADRDLLLRLHGNPIATEADVQVMQSVYERCGAVIELERQVTLYTGEALHALPRLELTEEVVDRLRDLIQQLTRRQK